MPEKSLINLQNSAFRMKVRGITYSGGGEPLFCRNTDVFKCINEASRFAKIALVTNGSLLNKVFERDMLQNFFYIIVTMFATSPQQYKRIAGIDNFKTVLNNLESIVSWKRKGGEEYPVIGTRVLITKDNYANINDFKKILYDLGLNYGLFQFAKVFEEPNHVIFENREIEFRKENDLNPFFGYSERPDIGRVLFTRKQYPRTRFCWSVLCGINAVINPFGDVYPCVPVVGNKNYCIGNINGEKFEEIWGSQSHREALVRLHERFESGGCNADVCRYMSYNWVFEQALKGVFKAPPKKEFTRRHAYFL